MKKILYLIAVFLFSISLFSCDEGEKINTSSNDNKDEKITLTKDEEAYIGLCKILGNNRWMNGDYSINNFYHGSANIWIRENFEPQVEININVNGSYEGGTDYYRLSNISYSYTNDSEIFKTFRGEPTWYNYFLSGKSVGIEHNGKKRRFSDGSDIIFVLDTAKNKLICLMANNNYYMECRKSLNAETLVAIMELFRGSSLNRDEKNIILNRKIIDEEVPVEAEETVAEEATVEEVYDEDIEFEGSEW